MVGGDGREDGARAGRQQRRLLASLDSGKIIQTNSYILKRENIQQCLFCTEFRYKSYRFSKRLRGEVANSKVFIQR